MTINLIYLIFLLTLSTCSSQIKEKEDVRELRDIMYRNDINLKNYFPIEQGTIKSYNIGFTSTNSKDSLKFKTLRVTNDVLFNTYEYTATDYSKFHDEYFLVKDQMFKIDDLVKENKINLKYNNPYFYLREYYVFMNENNKKLIIIHAQNRTFYRNRDVSSYFIIKINKDDILIKILYDI